MKVKLITNGGYDFKVDLTGKVVEAKWGGAFTGDQSLINVSSDELIRVGAIMTPQEATWTHGWNFYPHEVEIMSDDGTVELTL